VGVNDGQRGDGGVTVATVDGVRGRRGVDGEEKGCEEDDG
jgi:hypothetical protein